MAVIGKTIAELGIAELVELVRCQIERYRRELAALPPPAPLERPSSFEEGQLAEEAAYRAVEAVYGPPRPKFPRARKPLSFEARARRRCPSPAVAAVTGLQQPAFLGSRSHDVSEGASRAALTN